MGIDNALEGPTEYSSYFSNLESDVNKAYRIAEDCRSLGKDISDEVEIPLAKDLADRVEKLVGPAGISEYIREMLKDNNREMASIKTALEVARRSKGGKEDAIDQAIRTGLAILTEGILVAPLEGIASVYLGKNNDGSDYVGIKFAGPIRSAGGTAQALSVLIADAVRQEMGIGRFNATTDEIKRYQEAIPLYKRLRNLQYLPSNQEIELIVKNCPVCIDGEPTEKQEVGGQRDLPRVETNRVRGGACLVLAEGMALKANKILRNVQSMEMEGWDWLSSLTGLTSKKKGLSSKEGSDKYIKDLIVGRPVFSHPAKKGGFRLRYGRARSTGLAALAIHPATMILLDDFLAIGTQMKIELPGKACAVTPCDSLGAPIVLLRDGTLMSVPDMETARTVKHKVKEIIDLGEILVPFGEFLENNHPLLPGAYCEEWWAHQYAETNGKSYEEALKLGREIDERGAIAISEELGIPLHPRFGLFWNDLTEEQKDGLRTKIADHGRIGEGGWTGLALSLPKDEETKRSLVELGLPHRIIENEIVVEGNIQGLLRPLGLSWNGPSPEDGPIEVRNDMNIADFGITGGAVKGGGGAPNSSGIVQADPVMIMPKARTRIGGRMGRPEKANERKMKPPVHSLFPIGTMGGMQRLVKKAANNGDIQIEMGGRRCVSCRSVGQSVKCACGGNTVYLRPQKVNFNLKEALDRVRTNINEVSLADMKGVKGLISEMKIPEPLEKGFLRAKHDVFVNKDGTIRFEHMDVPLTHFRPSEIGTSVEVLRELGYEKDWKGEDLVSDDQICEIMVQDFIAPKVAGQYMVRVAKFVDDLLKEFYGQERFYNAERMEDLVGHLIVGLAPHTSGGVLGRIIGYTDTQAGFAHPFYHAAKRRNCDGDADSIMLLMDGLLNFSKLYLPSSRGGQMDAPLVLPIMIDPSEIDKEAHNIDTLSVYPKEFYEAAEKMTNPKDIAKIMGLVEERLGNGEQYSNFGFTHDTKDISEGPRATRYSLLGDMTEKLEAQLRLAEQIRAVDAADVASRVVESHLLRDIMGNLRTFSQQKFRCTSCGKKYRRVTLNGKCGRCAGNLILTVHKGNVNKYMDLSLMVSKKYNISNYTSQRIKLLVDASNGLFAAEEKGVCLDDFL